MCDLTESGGELLFLNESPKWEHGRGLAFLVASCFPSSDFGLEPRA